MSHLGVRYLPSTVLVMTLAMLTARCLACTASWPSRKSMNSCCDPPPLGCPYSVSVVSAWRRKAPWEYCRREDATDMKGQCSLWWKVTYQTKLQSKGHLPECGGCTWLEFMFRVTVPLSVSVACLVYFYSRVRQRFKEEINQIRIRLCICSFQKSAIRAIADGSWELATSLLELSGGWTSPGCLPVFLCCLHAHWHALRTSKIFPHSYVSGEQAPWTLFSKDVKVQIGTSKTLCNHASTFWANTQLIRSTGPLAWNVYYFFLNDCQFWSPSTQIVFLFLFCRGIKLLSNKSEFQGSKYLILSYTKHRIQ